ncbi:MAG: S8 family serine peptidase [Myxococcota bacterium]
MTKYSILRTTTGLTRDPFGSSRPGARRPELGEQQLTVERLSRKELAELARDPRVEAIASSMPIRVPVSASDDDMNRDVDVWGLTAIEANRCEYDGSGVVVAVLDSGIDLDHPAFTGMELALRNFLEGKPKHDVTDLAGHGTHCAGTIFGRDVDKVRIGVAPGVQKALIGRVIDRNLKGQSIALFQGMQWALEQGANVINISIGLNFMAMVDELLAEGWPEHAAVARTLDAYRGNLRMCDAIMGLARARGTIVVAATGNESAREQDPRYDVTAQLPASAEDVVAVGAVAKTPEGYVVPGFSNSLPTIAAPGVHVLSAAPGGGLGLRGGTSMAAPHVSGLAALWWQATNQADMPTTARTVTAQLLATARREGFAPSVGQSDRGVGLARAPR